MPVNCRLEHEFSSYFSFRSRFARNQSRSGPFFQFEGNRCPLFMHSLINICTRTGTDYACFFFAEKPLSPSSRPRLYVWLSVIRARLFISSLYIAQLYRCCYIVVGGVLCKILLTVLVLILYTVSSREIRSQAIFLRCLSVNNLLYLPRRSFSFGFPWVSLAAAPLFFRIATTSVVRCATVTPTVTADRGCFERGTIWSVAVTPAVVVVVCTGRRQRADMVTREFRTRLNFR